MDDYQKDYQKFKNIKVGDVLYRDYKRQYNYKVITEVKATDLMLSHVKITGFFFCWYDLNFGKYNRHEPHFVTTFGLKNDDFNGYLQDADQDVKDKFKQSLITAVFTTQDKVLELIPEVNI